MTKLHSEDYLKLNTVELVKELGDLSKKYNDAYAKKLAVNTRTKEVYAGLFIKEKQSAEKKSLKDIEISITINPDWVVQKFKDDDADKKYLKAKTDYNNMLTKISLLQSELKRELQLMGKEK